MDTNAVIPLFVIVFCGIRLIRTLASPNKNSTRGWLVAWTLVSVATAIGYLEFRNNAALISGIPFALFVLLPPYASAISARWLDRGYYQRAYALAVLAYVLHPFDDWDSGPVVARALLMASRGRVTAAIMELDRYRLPNVRIIAYAKVEAFRINGQWEALCAFLEKNIARFNDPYFINFYIRSFGETGDPNGMLAAYAKYRHSVKSLPYLDRMLLCLYAYCGLRDQTSQLAQIVFKKSEGELVKLWEETAALASGDTTATERIRELTTSRDSMIRVAANRRLTFPLPKAQDLLTPQSRQILELVDNDLVTTKQIQQAVRADKTRPTVTYILIAINCVFFVLEILAGGSEDFGALIKMGALMPVLVMFQHEWWRLLASMFLHFGVLHLGLNMLGLFRLGPFVERVLGPLRYTLLYFLAGLVPGLLMVLLAQYHLIDRDVVAVGASGAIMGVLGAEAAILLRAWRSTRSTRMRGYFIWIIVIVAIQSLFDLSVLTVGSMFVHLCGVIVGFLLALLVRHRASRFTMAVQ